MASPRLDTWLWSVRVCKTRAACRATGGAAVQGTAPWAITVMPLETPIFHRPMGLIQLIYTSAATIRPTEGELQSRGRPAHRAAKTSARRKKALALSGGGCVVLLGSLTFRRPVFRFVHPTSDT